MVDYYKSQSDIPLTEHNKKCFVVHVETSEPPSPPLTLDFAQKIILSSMVGVLSTAFVLLLAIVYGSFVKIINDFYGIETSLELLDKMLNKAGYLPAIGFVAGSGCYVLLPSSSYEENYMLEKEIFFSKIIHNNSHKIIIIPTIKEAISKNLLCNKEKLRF